MSNKTLQAYLDRIEQLKMLLRHYESVIADPGTLDAEIARRKAEVTKHLAAIERLEDTKANAATKADNVRADIKRTVEKANYKRLETKIEKWRKLNADLKSQARRAGYTDTA